MRRLVESFGRLRDSPDDQSGPAVAWLFHRLLGAAFVAAWLSMGVQIHELIGSRGLLPIASALDEARRAGRTGLSFPTPLWLDSSDAALTACIVVGLLLAVVALFGWRPRACLLATTALYLGCANAGRTFFGFQWDNLLVECGFLAALLPADRPARLVHVLFRLLLFKVYFESGVAKWQSPLGDWRDGSAMSLYYETAPLPTPLGFWAHALPLAWHRVESWATLALELVAPFLVFGPRRLRLVALGLFTAFQVAIAATANYGFFCFLVASLGVFLAADRDAWWITRRMGRRQAADESPRPIRAALERAVVAAVVTAWLWISATEAMARFGASPPDGEPNAWERAASPLRPYHAQFRFANTYHLFGHVTRERVEPEFETYDGRDWTEHALRYKPGPPNRAPPWVAPHQPRLDFQLWFHGLARRRGLPPWVATMLDRLCHDPRAVRGLFAASLPTAPQGARVAYWRTTFVTPEEHRRGGSWWRRERVSESPALRCQTADQRAR